MAAFSLRRLVSYSHGFILKGQQALCIVKVCGVSLQTDMGFPLVLITFHFIMSVSMTAESQILEARYYIKIFSESLVLGFLKRNMGPFEAQPSVASLAVGCTFQFLCFFFSFLGRSLQTS